MTRFFLVERAGAAERNRADVAEYLPLPLRRLDCERRISAIDQLACDETAIYKVEGQCVKTNDSGHFAPRGSTGERCLAAGAALQRPHYVLAGDDARKPLTIIDHRHTADAVINHELKHPG